MERLQNKDNFSARSEKYAQFRPLYPDKLYDWLLTHSDKRDNALDCGTGNGQVAAVLARHFKQVYATDISENQLKHAFHRDNITYNLESAEKSSFPDSFFDLITVAQAIHWFDFEAFYKEVKRILKPGGLFIVMGYGLASLNSEIDAVVDHFYKVTLSTYWDPERKFIDENYRTIPFPFKEIMAPSYRIEIEWDFNQFIGFFQTWSAVQHYIKENHKDPVVLLEKKVSKLWSPGEIKKVNFPVLLRVAKI